jgi:hypothetical protein
VGLSRLLKPVVDVHSLVRVALTGQDAIRRRYRVGATINERLEKVVRDAISVANEKHNVPLQRVFEGVWTSPVINSEGQSVAFGHRRLSIIDLVGGHQVECAHEWSVPE